MIFINDITEDKLFGIDFGVWGQAQRNERMKNERIKE
jgi:hypothetical protein